ncbi:hypothetical protein DFQ28_009058, partial [Apophysomyces sp. BC1034]
MYSEEIKVLVITYHLEKLVSAAKAGREYNVDERTAQRWIKEYKRQQQHGEPDEAKKKPGPKKTLGEEHKAHLMQYIDDNPSAVLNQAMESLTQQFEGMQHLLQEAYFHALARNSELNISKRYEWITKWQNSDMYFMKNCIFIDESGFHINQRRAMAWSQKGSTPIVNVATTKAIWHTILGAICAAGVVNTSIRKPTVKKSKKRKTGTKRKATTK